MDTVISFCSHTPTISILNPDHPWICKSDTLTTQLADSYQWYVGSFGNTMPFTCVGNSTQNIPHFAQYNGADQGTFVVMSTIAGSSEISQEFSYMFPDIGIVPYYEEKSGVPCQGNTLTVVVKNLYATDNIQWFKDGIALTSASTSTLEITDVGNYKYCVYAQNCPFDITYQSQIITFNSCTGINKNDSQSPIYVYPNPSNEFTIHAPSSLIGTTYQVIDILGNVIITGVLNEEKNSLKMNNFNAGMYFLTFDRINKAPIKLIRVCSETSRINKLVL